MAAANSNLPTLLTATNDLQRYTEAFNKSKLTLKDLTYEKKKLNAQITLLQLEVERTEELIEQCAKTYQENICRIKMMQMCLIEIDHENRINEEIIQYYHKKMKESQNCPKKNVIGNLISAFMEDNH